MQTDYKSARTRQSNIAKTTNFSLGLSPKYLTTTFPWMSWKYIPQKSMYYFQLWIFDSITAMPINSQGKSYTNWIWTHNNPNPDPKPRNRTGSNIVCSNSKVAINLCTIYRGNWCTFNCVHTNDQDQDPSFPKY